MSRKLKQLDLSVDSSKGDETNKKEISRIPEIELRKCDGVSKIQEDNEKCVRTRPKIVYK